VGLLLAACKSACKPDIFSSFTHSLLLHAACGYGYSYPPTFLPLTLSLMSAGVGATALMVTASSTRRRSLSTAALCCSHQAGGASWATDQC